MSKVFISYKRDDSGLTAKAESLQRDLEAQGLKVWRDANNLEAGQEWNKEIYEAIRTSGVLIVLLSPKALESKWVRREVDVAKGANVTVIPILVERQGANDKEPIDIDKALNELDIPRTQLTDWTHDTNQKISPLINAINKGYQKTEQRREEWMQSIPKKTPCRTTRQKADEYRFEELGDDHPLRLYIARGDITKMDGIDVVVNSENNYMQMGRFFETVSLSSQLRLKGARKAPDGAITYDTVQMDLNDQCLRGVYNIPVAMGYIVPTHAGDINAELSEQGFRYIFHLSSVTVNPYDQKKRTTPISNAAIPLAIENIFKEVRRINREKGVISPEGTEWRAYEESQKDDYSTNPIQSIVLPMFGTGHGGNPDVDSVAEAIIQSVVEHGTNYARRPAFTLNAIHIAAFCEEDYEIIKQAAEKDKRLYCVRPYKRR